MTKLRGALPFLWLTLIALLLLLPKLMLIVFLSGVPWASVGWRDVFAVGAQDMLMAVLVFFGLVLYVRYPTLPRLLIGYLVSGLMLFFLLLDCRVRQLWQNPIDGGLIRYFLVGFSDLSSGKELFFHRDAGLGLTLLNWLIVIGVTHALLWLLTAWTLRRARREPGAPAYLLPVRALCLVTVTMVSVLLLGACFSPHYLFRAEQNPISGSVVNLLTVREPSPVELRESAAAFEQKLRPLSEALAPPRVRLKEVKPFRNVVLIFLESFRWQDYELPENKQQLTPNLARMAREGMAGKCYVSIPHSCKSHYTVLTSCHPFPSLEVREGKAERFDSILWSMRQYLGSKIYCFSIQNLDFENLRNILGACGVERAMSPREMAEAAGLGQTSTSTYGSDDEALVEVPARVLAEGGEPFFAVMVPLGAHYPYYYDGKPANGPADIASYRKSMSRTDEILGRMLVSFEKRGLLRDTLFVLVGDHGESFGEHGTWIHNNSMYEEEIAAPLIFWSADRRLQDPEPIVARQIDIAPTIADLCGAEKADFRCHGESVLRQKERKPSPVFVSSFFDSVSQALIDGQDKYMLWPRTGTVLHYDLSRDPREQTPLAVAPEEKKKVMERLKAFAAYQKLLYETPGQRREP